ncbi:MAG: hypothetical protein WCJ40_17975 [Planctomycetota bacterium]
MQLRNKLVACLLVFSVSVAHARPADLITTPFTGTGIVSTNLGAVGDQSLPWTDTNGRTYTGGQGIYSSYGWALNSGSNINTISNLGSNITNVGWYINDSSGGAGEYITSASFNNGESWSGSVAINSPASFMGLRTATPFTSVTFTISNSDSQVMTDFITQVNQVPEPSTIISGTLCLLCFGLLAYRKSRKQRVALA